MKLKLLLICLIIAFLPGIIGSIFAKDNVDSEWYQVNKPSFTPPNYVFPIAWTILYIAIGISLYLSWTSAKAKQKNKIGWLFAINLILNAIWTPLFFTLKNPFLSLIDISLIVVSTMYLIVFLYKINKTASYILIPYLIWILFASILNSAFL